MDKTPESNEDTIYFQFIRPAECVARDLKKLLSEWPIYPVPDPNALTIRAKVAKFFRSFRSPDEDEFEYGTADEVISKVMERLENNYRRNVEEGFDFDYVVRKMPSINRFELCVDTRLLYPEGGSVSYGRVIRRISNDEYGVRIDT